MSNLTIGFNARIFANNWRPVLDEIAFATQHGFQAIQFRVDDEPLSPQILGASFAEVSAALGQANMIAVMELMIRIDAQRRTLQGHTPLQVLQANLPAITQLPCVHVHWHLVTLPGVDRTLVPQIEADLVNDLAEGVAVAQRHSFTLGFEHNDPNFAPFSSASACAGALAAVQGLGFVWDLNHTTPHSLADFMALIPRVTMLHVSDTPLPEVNHHLPLGLGNINFVEYCRSLCAGGFAGPAILEIGGLPKSGGYGRDTDVALVDSLALLQRAGYKAATQLR